MLGSFGILLACISTVAWAEEPAEPSPTMLRTAYCACRCCEENQAICFRHPTIPEDFKCSESLCSDKFCGVWNKAKCNKDCFCKQCKDKIPKSDYKCVSFKRVAAGCKCDDKPIDCSDVGGQLPSGMADHMKDASQNVARLDCVMPCLCKRCRHAILPAIYADCLKSEEPDADCNCEAMKCPSKELLAALKLLEEQRRKSAETGKEHSFTEEIDNQMSPEEAKKTKCKMQCYCEACSPLNNKIENTCERMLPNPRVQGCDCKTEDISCPSEDIDQHCKLYCFCKGCMKDSRMNIEMLQGCQAMTEKKQGCLCADKENCNMLEKLSAIQKEAKKEAKKEQEAKPKSKKGKLKPKKKDKDEL